MKDNTCVSQNKKPDFWSVRMLEQGIAAFHEMEGVKEELENILATLSKADTMPAYMALKILEVRADKEQKMVTAAFALSLRKYLEYLKNQSLAERILGVLMVCRMIRLILANAPEHYVNVVDIRVSRSLQQSFLRVSRCFLEAQMRNIA